MSTPKCDAGIVPFSINNARELSFTHPSNAGVLAFSRKAKNYDEIIKPHLREIISLINRAIESSASNGSYQLGIYFPIHQDVVPIKSSLFLHLQELYGGYKIINLNKSTEPPREFVVHFDWR